MQQYTASATPIELKTFEAELHNVQVLQNNSGFKVRIGPNQIDEGNGGMVLNEETTVIFDSPRTVFVKSNGNASLVIISEVL